ncbi:LPXTG cell wall anchor domain-containing protein [Pauljensenia sp. 20925_1_27]
MLTPPVTSTPSAEPTPSATPTPSTPSTPSSATPLAAATPSTPAPPTPKPKQLARTGADMAGILAGAGMLGLLGALAVAARRRQA